MYVGTLEADLLLGAIGSLKEKRSIVRPIINELRRRYEVSVAEVGDADLHRRAAIGLAVVSGDAAHVKQVLRPASGFSLHGQRWSCCQCGFAGTALTIRRGEGDGRSTAGTQDG